MEYERTNPNEASPLFLEKLTTLESLDRSFDLMFWQQQSATARFGAAWELVEFAWHVKGRDATELRIQRTVESLQPAAG